MKKIFLIGLISTMSTVSMARIKIYEGISPLQVNGKNTCQIRLTFDSRNEIVAYDNQGPMATWEILSENGGSYGPASDIKFERNDAILSDVKNFAKLNFQKSGNLFSDGYSLSSSKYIGGTIQSKFKIEFNVENNKLISVKKVSKFKALLVTMGSEEFICENLKLINK